MTKREIQAFQQEILSWYEKHQRDLPWRKTREPYRILVSEIMLQQTQVSRVIPKFEAWLQAFPDVPSLAKASTADFLRLWSGLGYNRRALYLQKAAQSLIESRSKNHESWGKNIIWPKTVEELKKLPGIGEYTARAVACFAFDQQIAVVDTNIRKVILTKFCHPEFISGSHTHQRKMLNQVQHDKVIFTDKKIQNIADELLPPGQAYEWNQALMDYASAMLKQEKIPVAKQSKFKGSNRYYRGQTVKLLLEKKQVSLEELATELKITPLFLEKIIIGLVKDELVKYESRKISLK
jgi:A/G-specific adenine glycosylase